MAKKFKQEVLDKIKSNPDLFAVVATAMNVMPTSLPVILDRNGNSLNVYTVVKAVSDYLKVKPESLLERYSKEKEVSK